jgi:hypothetical protein
MPGKESPKSIETLLKGTNDPFTKRLLEGESWGNVMLEQEEWEASNEGRRQREARRIEQKRAEIAKWEGQLKAVMKKPQIPSALRHKERLIESLRNGYTSVGRDPSNVNALVSTIRAEINAGATKKGGRRSTRRATRRLTRRQRK